jgi:prepilin-type processing-associated H-X9-DG protein
MFKTFLIAFLISGVITQPVVYSAQPASEKMVEFVEDEAARLTTLQPSGVTEPLLGFFHIQDLPGLLEKQGCSKPARLIDEIINLVLSSGKDRAEFSEIVTILESYRDIQGLKLPFNGQIFIPIYGEVPKIGFVADVDEKGLPVFLERLVEVLKKADAPISLTKKMDGGEIRIEDLKVVYRVLDGKFIAGVDEEAIGTIVSLNKIFKSSPGYARAAKNVDADQVTFVDLVSVLGLFENKMPASTREALQKTGVLDIESLIITQKMDETGMHSKSSIIFKESVAGVFKLVAPPNTGQTVHKYIPSNYNFLYRLKTADYALMWKTFCSLFNEFSSERDRNGFKKGLADFNKELGFDIESDLIACLGGEIAIAVSVPKMISVPPVLLFIEVKDREKLEKTLDLIIEKTELKLYSSTFQDHKINTIAAPILQPTYTFKDNYLIVSINPAGLREVIQLNEAVSIFGRAEYKSVRAMVPEKGTSEIYIEMDKIMQLGLTALAAYVPQAGEDPLLKQIIEKIQGEMNEPWPVISLMTSSSDSISSVVYEKHGSVSGLVGIGIMAAVMMPALLKSEGVAKRNECSSEMKRIYAGLMMYKLDYCIPPVKLSQLSPHYVQSLTAFTCPETGVIISNKDEIDSRTSYLYRVADLGSGDTDSLLLADIPGNHGRTGINVVSTYGAMSWLVLNDETLSLINRQFNRSYKLEDIPQLTKRRPGVGMFPVLLAGFAFMGMSSISPAALFIGAGMFIPAVTKSRAKARETVCMSNIKQLLVASIMYHSDNGKYPEKLSELSDYTMGLAVFTCLASGDPPISDATRIDSETSYLYHKPDSDNPNIPLICDKPRNHGGKGVNVGFVDGHVEWKEAGPSTDELMKKYFKVGAKEKEHAPAH